MNKEKRELNAYISGFVFLYTLTRTKLRSTPIFSLVILVKIRRSKGRPHPSQLLPVKIRTFFIH